MKRPLKRPGWHPGVALGIGAVAAGLLVAAIPAMRAPTAPAIPAPTDQTSVCIPGQSESTAYVLGDSALSSGLLGDQPETGAAQLVATKQTRPLVITSAKRFAAGVLTTDAGTASWSRCVAPRTTGLVQLVSAQASELVLVNTDDTAAVVDFSLYGQSGEIPALGSRGLTLPPRSSRPLPVAVLVPEDQPVGVEMRVTSGRIAVVGRSWVSSAADFSPAATPATSVLLPGVFATPKQTRVLVTNPGDQVATVNVAALTTQRIALQGAQAVEVPARATTAIDVTGSLGGEAATLAVTSDQPVAATAIVSTDRDYAVSGASDAFTVGRLLAPSGGVLSVSNPSDAPVTVTLSVTVDGGTPAKQEIAIPAGRTWTTAAPTTGTVEYNVLATSPVVAAVSGSQPGSAWIAPLQSLTQTSVADVTMAYRPRLR